MNYALTHSSAQIAKEIIRPIWTYVYSGSIALIENENIKSFIRVEDNQFIQLWMVTFHDYQRD